MSKRRPTAAERLFRRARFSEAEERSLLQAFFGDAPGVFVEVGANDPVRNSQTHHFEMAGWRGVLVEPLRECAELLRQQRQARVFEVAAGGPEDDGKLLPLLVKGAASTLEARIRDPRTKPVEVRKVPIRTLDSILEEAGIGAIDFLSIDVEGAEVAVLRGFSIERYRPRLLFVEDDLRDLRKHRHLVRRGYRLVRRTGINSWYLPVAAPFPVSGFGRWQLFRKLYLGLWPRRLKYRWLQARMEGFSGASSP